MACAPSSQSLAKHFPPFSKALGLLSGFVMKNKAKTIIATFVIIALFIVSSLTFTLCGGTLTQNRLGTGSCSFAQDRFNGFASPFQYQTELAGIVVILIAVFLILTFWLIYLKTKGKK